VSPIDGLSQALRDAAGAHGVPGAVAGLLVGDDRYIAAHGVTNVEYPRPASSATLFQVGSITKTFTSAAVMVLVQEGLLALDDPVARHLPDLGAATGLDFEAITVERALSHQTGFDGDHCSSAPKDRISPRWRAHGVCSRRVPVTRTTTQGSPSPVPSSKRCRVRSSDRWFAIGSCVPWA
jgi:CubicO group peptidase (beta-lactamase class C family)